MNRYQFLFILLLIAGLFPQTPFNLSPSWVSGDLAGYSTGCGWADINKDGWPDLVISDGNDMARQHVIVYLNHTGSLSSTPDWQSSDIDYNGHLAIGDINKDGYPDVAVAVYIGQSGFSSKGKVKLYMNNGGTLSANPSWISGDSLYAFSCAFGDADGDGDLDLAVAAGEAYYNGPEKNRIYFNNIGILESRPSWKSTESGFSYDVTFADIDNDGRLDLVFGCEKSPNKIYKNYGDSIATSATWTSTDNSQQANSIFTADIDNDGFLDLAVSDNNQTGGTGRFKIYKNHNGILEQQPSWNSSFNGYGSGITFADINNDGYKDLICGGWWNPVSIFSNNHGTFSTTPQWNSNTSSVVEAIMCCDMDKLGLISQQTQFTCTGERKLFYLPNSPIQSITAILLNDSQDSIPPFCFDLESGWISFKTAPNAGARLKIVSIYSSHLDFAVSNWDTDKGNYLFKNTSHPVIPVELQSFTCQKTGNHILLNWETGSEKNNTGFEVQRSPDNFASETKIGFIAGAGSSPVKHHYSFTDRQPNEGKNYYRLKQVNNDGSFTFSPIIELDDNQSNADFGLNCYPNPFNPGVNISFALAENANVKLLIYNLKGETVKEIVNAALSEGIYNYRFDASALPSGTYFCSFQFNGRHMVRKIILLK